MNAKRDRIAIIHDMLRIISNEGDKVKPTRIMYKANLSHQMLTEYMGEILSKGFIIENIDKRGRRTYMLTDKGCNFLRDYQIIKNFFESYGLT